jgi:hypothetical protein
LSGTVEHRRIDVDARDGVPGAGKWHGQSTAAGREFQDRAARPVGQRQI